MSDDAQTSTATVAEPTDARFSMRAMLLTMAVVSILAAIGGAYIRKSSPELQTRLVAFWTGWLAFAIGLSYYQILLRKRAEDRAGATLLKLNPLNYSVTLASACLHVFSGIVVILLGLYIAGDSIAETSQRKTPMEWLMMFAMPIVYSVWASSHILPRLAWQRQVRFCEFGILWDRRLLPWDHVSKYKWSGYSKDSLEIYDIDDMNRRPWLKAKILLHEREMVTSILAERTRVAGKSLWGATGIGRVPISSLLQTKMFRQHLGALATCVSLGLCLAYLAWLNWGNVPTLDDSVMASFYVICLLSPWKWLQVGMHAGAPLVRLFARREWLGVFVNFALALTAYYVGHQWGWSSAVVGYAAGFVFCFMMFKVISYFFTTQCDFRENGVVLYGAFCWPWQGLRISAWDPHDTGRLVLQRDWRKLVAEVPLEQREAVERVLREKLPTVIAPNSNCEIDRPTGVEIQG